MSRIRGAMLLGQRVDAAVDQLDQRLIVDLEPE
jgi:hypothetical protein